MARRTVTLSDPPEMAGEYVVDEVEEDGSIRLHPDTSVAAMLERSGGGRVATAEEFDAICGHLPTDDEG